MCGWATTYAANKEEKEFLFEWWGCPIENGIFVSLAQHFFLLPPLYFFKTTALGLPQGSTIKVQEKFY